MSTVNIRKQNKEDKGKKKVNLLPILHFHLSCRRILLLFRHQNARMYELYSHHCM